jgi:hypothetical protein
MNMPDGIIPDVRLYHFTTHAWFAELVSVGAIATTWPRKPGAAWPWPRVAWLTKQPDPDRQGWKVAQTHEVRVTVDVPDSEAHPWSTCKGELPPETVSGLETSAKVWGGNPADWYVVRRPIPTSEWIEVLDLDTNKVLKHSERARPVTKRPPTAR